MEEVIPCLAISAMWGITPHITKYVTTTNSPLEYNTLRSLVEATILILAFMNITWREDKKHKNRMPDSRMWWVILGGTLTMGASLWFSHIVRTTTHLGLLTAFTYPLGIAFAILFGRILRNEKLTLQKWVGIALCIVSCIIMSV